MYLTKEIKDRLLREVKYQTSRSSGPGGQNVNKVSSKVELFFDINASTCFDESQKVLIFEKLKNRINFEGKLRVEVQQTRSQLQNKVLSGEVFFELLERALTIQKKRLPTKPSKNARLRRLKSKRMISEKKVRRRKDF